MLPIFLFSCFSNVLYFPVSRANLFPVILISDASWKKTAKWNTAVLVSTELSPISWRKIFVKISWVVFLIHVRAVFPTYRNWSVGLHWNSIEWLLCDWTIAVTLIDEWILSVNVIKLKDVEISIQTISEKCQTPVTGFFLTEVAVCQLYPGRTLLLMFLLALNIKHPTSQNDAKPDKTTHNQPNPPTNI